MTTERIKEIQERTACPDSVSVKQALLQVWNECEQQQVKNNVVLPNVRTSLRFGDYARIEQKRHGCDNEIYLHKVIRELESNSYVDVPVEMPIKEVIHDEVVEVYACICCGVDETKVLKYKATDVICNTLYLNRNYP